MTRKIVIACVSLFAGLLFMLPATGQAADPTGTISVQPASLNIEISKDFPEQIAMVTVTNNYAKPVNLVAEFKGIDPDSGRIIPAGEPGSVITETLKLSESIFTIQPKKQHFLKIAATDNSALTSGGHYATLVIREQTGQTVPSSINSMLSIGIFMVKRDGAKDNIVLTKQQLSKSLFGMPSSLELEFLNDGNVHLTPRASIVLSSGQKNYSEAVINQQSRIILPTKRYAESMNFQISNQPKLLPKSVTLTLTYRAEGSDATKISKQTFIVIPELFWLIPISLLLSIFYLLVFQKNNVMKVLKKLGSINKILTKNHH